MNNMEHFIDNMHLDSQLTLEDIPDLNLYMDQVIQLFENKFAASKRNDDEKVLTKTMINNYAKGKLFFPVKNKKYSREHLMLISMIYQMKGALSINDVKQTLEKLNENITDKAFNLQDFYDCYLKLDRDNVDQFSKAVHQHSDAVHEKVKHLDDDDKKYLEQLLMVAVMTNMSNYYRRAAEKMVDAIGKEEKGHQK
ncbi:DUF1836 domain-containing protein [Virgibacillus siamensis]|uniref:DUF1836 domain-containing protein n=1 Tax=Virgibacillus siamensis TaxID=480071 RepID=UPI0009878F7D|nr:DUF1836 domain-containing protein [Virgibacillus siamensis]